MTTDSRGPGQPVMNGTTSSSTTTGGRVVQDDTSPLSIFLVKSGARGDRLLFRYPFPNAKNTGDDGRRASDSGDDTEQIMKAVAASAPRTSGTELFPMITNPEILKIRSVPTVDPHVQMVVELSDIVLSHLFAVKTSLCDQKFEVKINDVRFVGHPICLSGHGERDDLLTVNVVFALKANANHDTVDCYHECSQRISIGLKFEEQRTGYLSKESTVMLSLLPDDMANSTSRATFEEILRNSPLAATLKKVFDDLSKTGITHVTLNKWMSISFCLPQKVHRLALMHHESLPSIGPARITKCFEHLRPYHGVLLISDPERLQESLPQDSSPAFFRVIRCISPTKNLLELSADADITLSQVFHVVAQLVYWGKATVIYPFCESNKYTVHPLSPTNVDSIIAKSFAKEFGGNSLLRVLSEFSMGVTVKELSKVKDGNKKKDMIRQILWLLKHRLLLQVHTYIFYVPLENGDNHSRSNSPSSDDLENILLRTKDTRERQLFQKLQKGEYFDGRRHLEDIMYYEDVERSELISLLEKFNDILFTVEHDDLAVSQLCPYNNFS